MKIRIICPGKIRERFLSDGIDEYKKRLSKYCTVEIIEVPDCPDTMPIDQALATEGEKILSKISSGDVLWVMDIHGKEYTSEELSAVMVSALEKGGSTLSIAIGGSNGLSPELVKRADRRVCFGKITMTHQMTRLLLMEQLYRGFKIFHNEKYHK
ncbi:MAG: 23S rRNA (pseudouridine(1915)-N(3))-methyltransferase RlmH [Saccharofermentans sp.]|nr:23S rRNA (pseudouridine(1915)-N(3))-methyltransferase RlmH [Saccharofermentans sp.]